MSILPTWPRHPPSPISVGEYEILQQLAAIRKAIQIMSTTLSGQIDAETATITADAAALNTALATIQTELAGLTPGSTVTQAQVDALHAAVAQLGAAVSTAQTEANPPAPPAPPPATP